MPYKPRYPSTKLGSKKAQIMKAIYQATPLKHGALARIGRKLGSSGHYIHTVKREMERYGVIPATLSKKTTTPTKNPRVTVLDSNEARIRRALHNATPEYGVLSEIARQLNVPLKKVYKVQERMRKEGIINRLGREQQETLQQRLIALLKEKPGLTTKQAAEILGAKNAASVRNAAYVLEKKGILVGLARKIPAKPTASIEQEIEEKLDKLGITDRTERMKMFTQLAAQRLLPAVSKALKSAQIKAANARSIARLLSARGETTQALELSELAEELENAIEKSKAKTTAEERMKAIAPALEELNAFLKTAVRG